MSEQPEISRNEPEELPAAARRGASADEAGGSVAEGMRTPSAQQEAEETALLEQFDEHA